MHNHFTIFNIFVFNLNAAHLFRAVSILREPIFHDILFGPFKKEDKAFYQAEQVTPVEFMCCCFPLAWFFFIYLHAKGWPRNRVKRGSTATIKRVKTVGCEECPTWLGLVQNLPIYSSYYYPLLYLMIKESFQKYA